MHCGYRKELRVPKVVPKLSRKTQLATGVRTEAYGLRIGNAETHLVLSTDQTF